MLECLKTYMVMDYSTRIPFQRTMNLFIETLTGTCFELRVSPFETVLSVKAKIQRLEGIPISQQHLIWEGAELDDDYCLHDYRIKDSCMLKLVLAMRGGPINTRRIAMDDSSLLDMADYLDINQEDLLEELSLSPPVGKSDNNSQVTLLVYRNGDQINFFRVVDPGADGAITPVSESFSGGSFADVEDLNGASSKPKRTLSRMMENRITASKMKHLQGRMHDLHVKENAQHNLPTITCVDHSKPKEKKTERSIEVLATPQSESHPPSDKMLSDLERRSPRTERLLRALKPQRYSTNALQRVGSSSGKSSLPSHVTRRISSNSHSEYLRFYGLQQLEQPLKEDEESSLKKPSEMSRDVKIQSTATTDFSFANSGNNTHALSQPKPSSNKKIFLGDHSNTSSEHRRQTFEPRKADSNTLSRVASANTKYQSQTLPTEDSSIIPQLPTHLRSSEKLPNLCTSDKIFSSTYKMSAAESRNCGRTSSLNKPKSLHSECENTISEPMSDATNRTLPGNLLCHRKQPERYLPNSATSMSAVSKSKRLGHEKDMSSIGVDCLRMMSCYSQKPSHSPTILPPVRPLVLKKKRCLWCGKKTGLATSYICRCGKNFCATHRYAETHNCTFDYKSSGRQLLKDNNPIVTAPKLPKI